MKYSRQKVVDLAESWLGKNESDGSFKSIIDIYNSQKTFPQGVKMRYDWAWCACTWSALAIKLGYTDIMPIEISCPRMIEVAKKMGCWVEDDSYTPSPADAVIYDWDDSGVGDNKGNADHIGVVVSVNKNTGYMITIEGNYSNAVKKRTLSLNGRYIRGYITPKYNDNKVSKPAQSTNKDITTIAREVIAGVWGTGNARKKALEDKGYDFNAVQSKVNEILKGNATKTPTSTKVETSCKAKKYNKKFVGTYTPTLNLYLRNDAGTNKKALALIPKGTKVKCYGYYNVYKTEKWYLIQYTLNGVTYTGFSHSGYLQKV